MANHNRRYEQLTEMIIAERKKRGLKQSDIAEHLGTSQSAIARIETGGRRIDVIEFLELAEILGFNASMMIRRLTQIART